LKITNEIKTGVLAVFAIGLFIFGYSYLKSNDIFVNDRTFYALYSDVEGVVNGTPVTVNGFPVGSVQKISFYENNDLLRIINEIDQMINDKRDDKMHSEIINELSEDVNIFVTNMVERIKSDTDFTFILDNVRSFSTCNIKEYPGISSRVKFKYMDMLDLFK